MKKKFILLFLCLQFSLLASEENFLSVDWKISNFKYYSPNGRELYSNNLIGKKVLINFSSTWCPHCIEEKKRLDTDYRALLKDNPNLEIIVIFGSYGKGEKVDTPLKVNNYLTRNKYGFPIFFDKDKSLLKLFNVSTIPINFLIDENGTIIESSQNYYNLNKLYNKKGI